MTRPRRKPSARAVALLFEPGLVDRLKTQYGDVVDVDREAACAIDFCRRKVVSNPSGLLVTWVRDAAAKARGGVMSPAQQHEEGLRYVEFQLQVYRLVAEQQLGPRAIAQYLSTARQDGFPKLSAALIDRLNFMGENWPASATEDGTGRGVA